MREQQNMLHACVHALVSMQEHSLEEGWGEACVGVGHDALGLKSC